VEIFYCSSCRSRVTGAEFEAGKAFRSGDRVYCKACAPPGFESRPSPAPSSSSRLAAPPRPASTRRAVAAPKPGKSRAVWIGVGVALAIGIAAAVAFSGGGPPPAPPPPPPPPPAPVAKPVPSPPPPEKRPVDLTELEAKLKEALGREEFGRAAALLEEALKDPAKAEAAPRLDRRLAEVRNQARALFLELEGKSKAEGADVAKLAARVAAWGLPEHRIVPPPPKPVGPAVVVYDERLGKGWSDWSYSTQRVFDATSAATGSCAISATFERLGAGLYLHVAPSLDGSSFRTLEFAGRSEGPESQSLVVSLMGAENKRVGQVSLAQHGGHPPVGRWQRYSIPIAALEGAGKPVTGLIFQGVGKMTMKPVYLDDIVLKP
jgi:hypothetical protein